MKKKLLFLVLVLAVGCTLLIACGGSDPADTTAPATTAPVVTTSPASTLGAVTFTDATATYDGTAKTIAVAGAPAGATVTYAVNGGAAASAVSVTDAGVYTVVATVTAGNESVTKTATLTINKAIYTLPAGTVYFPAEMEVAYDGQYHTPEAVVALPDGVTAIAVGTPLLNAGESATYVINFSFSDAAMNKNYQAPNALEGITLTVVKADIDISGIVFDDLTVPYDGKYHTITPANVPAMLTCRATMPAGSGINRGEYTVTGNFYFINAADAANYNLPAPITAKLTIGAGAIDMPVFSNVSLPYSGANRVSSVPAIDGIDATKTVMKITNAAGAEVPEAILPGVYTVELTFTVTDTEKYLPVDPITYTLTITKATLSDPSASAWAPDAAWDVETATGGYFNYAEGVQHAVKVNLPIDYISNGVTVSYIHTLRGQDVTDTSAPGLYTTIAVLSIGDDKNYVLPENYNLGSFTWLVADKNADPDAVTYSIEDKVYDGDGIEFGWSDDDVAGILGSSYVLYDEAGNQIAKEDAKNVGVYTIVITFTTDAVNGYAPLTVEKTIEITPKAIDLSNIVVAWDHPLTEGKPFFYYDGATKTVKLTDATVAALQEIGVTVDGYTGNSKKDTGDYTAVATLSCDSNHAFAEGEGTFEFAWGIATPDDDVWSDELVK